MGIPIFPHVDDLELANKKVCDLACGTVGHTMPASAGPQPHAQGHGVLLGGWGKKSS